MGAQNDAFWGLDAPDNAGGIERCFAMYYATARDFARYGKLLNHDGAWNGQQLVDSAFVAAMVQPIAERSPGCDASHYGYQIWLGETEDGLAVRTGFDKDPHKTDDLPSCIDRIISMGRGLYAKR